MTVHKSSRYNGSYLMLDTDIEGGLTYIAPLRDNIFKPELEDTTIIFKEGMRVDLLAHEYYGDYNLDWVIMDCNPKYNSPFEIKVGDLLVIPQTERVINRE